MNKAKNVVVHVVQHLLPGGIESLCLEMLLKSKDVKVHIISLEGTFQEMSSKWPRLLKLAPRLHFVNKPAGFKPSVVWQVARLMRRLNAKVIHTHHIGPLLYGGMAAKLAGIKTHIHTEHDAWHLENAKHKKIVKRCIRLLKPKLIADADVVAQALIKAVPECSPSVIHNGVDTGKFKPGIQSRARRLLNLPPDTSLVGCAARMQQVKGHDILLDAMFRLPSGVHLALAGGGPEEERLRQQVKDLKLDERVHFLGLVQDMPAFYQAIDIFCLASRAEGMPLSPLEAQACGTPAVITNVGGSAESLCKDSGFLVEPQDSVELANTISTALSKPEKANPRNFVMRERNLQGMLGAYQALHAAN